MLRELIGVLLRGCASRSERRAIGEKSLERLDRIGPKSRRLCETRLDDRAELARPPRRVDLGDELAALDLKAP
jgi:hypothetical protein